MNGTRITCHHIQFRSIKYKHASVHAHTRRSNRRKWEEEEFSSESSTTEEDEEDEEEYVPAQMRRRQGKAAAPRSFSAGNQGLGECCCGKQ